MSNEHQTRLRLGGMEVDFVKWLPKGLIYTRIGSEETIASLNQASVRRLVREGTLEIEGYCPEWVWSDDDDSAS